MGLVASLSRPGGNATGVNLLTLALKSKKLDLLNRLVPSTGTFAYLTNPNNPAAEERANEMRDTARSLGRSLLVVGASTPTEIDAAFALSSISGSRRLWLWPISISMALGALNSSR